MNRWDTVDKWVITDNETDEPIVLYSGTFMEITKVINKAFKFNKPVTIERYKLFDSYDDLYDIAVIESTNPRARYSSDFEESIANGWIYG